jgi:hypothetical protein
LVGIGGVQGGGVRYPLVLLASRPLVFGAAFASFALLFLLATLPSLYFLNLEFLDSVSLVGTPWFNALCIAVVLLSGLSGLTVARFGLRLVPVRFGARVQVRAFVFGLSVLFLLAFFAWLAVFSPIEDDRPNARLGPWFERAAPEEVRIAGAIAVMVFAACAVIPFLWRHARPKAFLNQSFVLYLRRFSTFSDRSVMNEMLRACPHGKPLVFLTPTRSAVRDWNPFQIGLAGLRIRNPIRSMPIPVRADDAFWQSAARELIQAAETLVLDASEGSAAIDIETELIKSSNGWDKTVLLRIGAVTPADGIEKEPLAGGSVGVIRYKRNWWRAIPRLILGPIVSVFPGIWLGVILYFIASAVLLSLRRFGADVDVENLASDPIALLVLIGIPTAWIYFVLFWRPAINKEAAAALANRLRESPQTGTL